MIRTVQIMLFTTGVANIPLHYFKFIRFAFLLDLRYFVSFCKVVHEIVFLPANESI